MRMRIIAVWVGSLAVVVVGPGVATALGQGSPVGVRVADPAAERAKLRAKVVKLRVEVESRQLDYDIERGDLIDELKLMKSMNVAVGFMALTNGLSGSAINQAQAPRPDPAAEKAKQKASDEAEKTREHELATYIAGKKKDLARRAERLAETKVDLEVAEEFYRRALEIATIEAESEGGPRDGAITPSAVNPAPDAPPAPEAEKGVNHDPQTGSPELRARIARLRAEIDLMTIEARLDLDPFTDWLKTIHPGYAGEAALTDSELLTTRAAAGVPAAIQAVKEAGGDKEKLARLAKALFDKDRALIARTREEFLKRTAALIEKTLELEEVEAIRGLARMVAEVPTTLEVPQTLPYFKSTAPSLTNPPIPQYAPAPVPVAPATPPSCVVPVESSVPVFVAVETTGETIDDCKDYPLAGPCRLVHRHYKAAVPLDDARTGDSLTSTPRVEVVYFDTNHLVRCRDAAHRHPARPEAPPARIAPESDAERRMDAIEGKLDKPFKALDAAKRPIGE